MTPYVRWLYAQYPDGMPPDFPHCLPDHIKIPPEYEAKPKPPNQFYRSRT